MRLSNYTLTPTRINNAKAKARLYKLSDGGGLFVEVSTTGQKTWRYQYRFAGSRRDVKIGRYPEIGVADARARHFELRSLLERGVDPAEVRRQETAERRQQAKDSQPAADQFEAFSRRWIRERLMTRSETYRNQIESRLERFVWPAIGEKPLGGVRPADVLAIIEDLRGTPKTAEGVRQHIQQIYNYAIQKLLVEVNPALPLRGVIEVPAAEHHRHLTEPELGAFWRSVAKQGAHFVTIAATRMLMYTMCRKSEVLRARWREFDLERAQWDIPAERMKMKAPHTVPLARQAVALLGAMPGEHKGPELLLPSPFYPGKPMSENTLNSALARMGFKGEHTAHGFRALFSTIANERGHDADAIERQLAHVERNQVRAAYHRATYLAQRRELMQWWADWLDGLAQAPHSP